MKRRGVLCGIFILLILSVWTRNVNNGIVSFENTQGIDAVTSNLSYTPSDPVLIQSNADFETQGWPGNGTEQNPYVIANLSISSTGDCIIIEDTTVHFVIRNCTLNSSGETYGVYFTHVVNGIIEKCVINRNTWGIYLSYCNNCSIVNNALTDISYNGIWIRYSNNCTVAYNSLLNCTGNGVAVVSSTGCTLKNNSFIDCGPVLSGTSVESYVHSFENNSVNGKTLGYFVGLNDSIIDCSSYGQAILVNCLNVTITNGFFANSSVGVQVAFSEKCNFLNNVISHNRRGMLIINTTECYLRENSIVDNFGRGIIGVNSSHFNMIDNLIFNNSGNAIYLRWMNGLRLENNNMLNNLGPARIWYSNSCMIMNNSLSGLEISWSENCIISGNHIKNSHWIGLKVHDCNEGTIIVNNTITNSFSNGVEIFASRGCIFSDNIVYNNSGYGVLDIFSNHGTLVNNNITENTQLGIWLYGSSEMLLYSNRIGWNNGGNARDNGSDNQWDDGISIGNYWSDYDGYGEYGITGDAGSLDRYPFSLGEAPFLDHPLDIEFVFGTTGHTISWNPSDSDPESYEVFRNSTLLTSEVWTGLSINIDIDGLDVGTNNYTLIVYDAEGYWVADTVMVFVKVPTTTPATTPSEFNPSQLIILSIGVIGAVIVVVIILKVKPK